MSVLDRAIIKAYALQQNSASQGSSKRLPLRAAELRQSGQASNAALTATEPAARLLVDEVDGVSPEEWESLTSSLSTASPAVSGTAVQVSPSTHTIDTDSAVELDQSFVFESAVAIANEPQPEAIETDEQELAPLISKPSSFETYSDGSSSSATATATLAPAVAAASSIHPATTRPTEVAWEWPEICEQLDQFTGDGFRQLAKHLQFAAAQGHKVLAFVGTTANTGRTSVVLTLTRILALEGRTHALLIDADRRHPELAGLTKLSAADGLCEVLYGQAGLSQASTRRTPGLISLLPLRTPVSDAEWGRLVTPLRTLVKRAKQEYDLVLIDAGVFGVETRLADCWLRDAADAVITISRQLTGSNTTHDVLNWKQIGIESLGVIETFS